MVSAMNNQISDEIQQIVSIYVNAEDNLVVQAYLEGRGKQTVRQTLFDPPEFAPGLCETVVNREFLPLEVNTNRTEEELIELISRYNLLEGQSWDPISDDDSDQVLDSVYF
jgi:hypothetical protein